MDKGIKFSIYGAAIGDYYGSYWEFRADKPKDAKDALTLRNGHHYTDDTAMTMALASASTMGGDLSDNAIREMRRIGGLLPTSYGGSFNAWLHSEVPSPYWSYGNGAAMRVSSAGLSATSLKDAKDRAFAMTKVTHDHPFGIFYAEVVAELVYLAKFGDTTMDELKNYLKVKYPELYDRVSKMDLEDLHRHYRFDESCQGTVPEAIFCFLGSTDFADCLARSLYVGGDSDTLAAIACSIAAPFYGDGQVKPLVERLPELPEPIREIPIVFSSRYLC